MALDFLSHHTRRITFSKSAKAAPLPPGHISRHIPGIADLGTGQILQSVVNTFRTASNIVDGLPYKNLPALRGHDFDNLGAVARQALQEIEYQRQRWEQHDLYSAAGDPASALALEQIAARLKILVATLESIENGADSTTQEATLVKAAKAEQRATVQEIVALRRRLSKAASRGSISASIHLPSQRLTDLFRSSEFERSGRHRLGGTLGSESKIYQNEHDPDYPGSGFKSIVRSAAFGRGSNEPVPNEILGYTDTGSVESFPYNSAASETDTRLRSGESASALPLKQLIARGSPGQATSLACTFSGLTDIEALLNPGTHFDKLSNLEANIVGDLHLRTDLILSGTKRAEYKPRDLILAPFQFKTCKHSPGEVHSLKRPNRS